MFGESRYTPPCNPKGVKHDASLPPIQKKEVSDILNTLKSVISTLPGRSEGVQNCINIENANPIATATYRMTRKSAEKITKQIEDILKMGIQ